MDMQTLKTLFPRNNAKHHAATGLIPMPYFVANEAAIRAAAAEYFTHGYRAMFRGPRAYKSASMTHRADATGILLYSR
jgi:hypothetical protein